MSCGGTVVIEGDVTAQLSATICFSCWLQRRVMTTGQHPTKTLSGFAYRGHVFWDTEIFIVPFLTFTQPQVATCCLTATILWTEHGVRLAKLAMRGDVRLESASTGDEVTPVGAQPEWQPIRIWCGDIELHINTDIACGLALLASNWG